MHISEKFKLFVEEFRKPDGGRWGGQELQEATGGVVTRSYISSLRKGKIENPGYDKLRAIAYAMKFSPELWFEDLLQTESIPVQGTPKDYSVQERLERLFANVIDRRKGRPYTEAEIAQATMGDLTEGEIAKIRSGDIANPTLKQVLALADAFGVSLSYFTGKNPPLISDEILSALSDKASKEILHKTIGLSEGEKRMVLDMVDHLGKLHGSQSG